MPKIVGVSTSVPHFTLKQADAKRFVQSVFSDTPDVTRLLPVFDNANIDERHFVVAPEWYDIPHSFTETNDRYIEEALALSEVVTRGVAKKAGIALDEIDLIIFVSTTGISTPSIDARLCNRVEFNPHIKRLPIWGLGCAAGAAGIARAFDYASAYPEAIVLVVSVELCGLAFQKILTKENIIASALFGDGAAAAIIVGDQVDRGDRTISHPTILGSLSTIYPDTLDVMGWRITGEGLQLLLSKDIPTIVTKLVRDNILELLEKYQLGIQDIAHYVTHPGGSKVLDAYRDTLGLSEEHLRNAKEVLRTNGNMSSATVFFILERFLRDEKIQKGSYGLISALGPGFSSELVLICW